MLTNLSAAFIIAQAEVPELGEAFELINFGKILTALFLIVIAWMVNRFVMATLDRIGEGQAKHRLMMKKIASFTRLGIFVVAAYLVVMTFLAGETTALLGLGGTLALALGFALKDTGASLMSGILILIDQPFQVGDRVQFGDTYGEVKEIGLRSVRIVTLDDNEVSIPNNKFLTESVASANAGELDMMVEMAFYIAPTEDFDLGLSIVREAVITSRYVYLKKNARFDIREDIRGSTVVTRLRLRAYVIDARYEGRFRTDINQRVKRAFRKHRIAYPYERSYNVLGSEFIDDQMHAR